MQRKQGGWGLHLLRPPHTACQASHSSPRTPLSIPSALLLQIGRLEVLRIHTRNMKLDDDVDLEVGWGGLRD